MTPELISLLEDLEFYFDNKADADNNEPNEEMKLLVRIREVMEKCWRS